MLVIVCVPFGAFFLCIPRLPRRPPLFPYTTLFRSGRARSGPPRARPAVRRARCAAARPSGGGTAAGRSPPRRNDPARSEEHTSELQSRGHLVCRLLLEKKNSDQDLSERRPKKRARE